MRYSMRDGNLAFNLNDLNSPGGLALAAGLLALCGIRGQGDREAMERVEKAEEARRREEMARKKAEDKAEEEMKARMQAETKAEEEARAREMADALAAVALAERAETEEKLKMEQRLRELGVEPDREVSEEEIRNARARIGYVDGSTNIAVVGRQNEGKSTLVNVLRGLRNGDPGSAKVGEAETTLQPKAYPDHKHPGFVWHDIPGGGTKTFSAWMYYYTQNLFAYDKILLVHCAALSEMDLRIMQVCKFRRQECVVVRSKADEHIRNCRRNNKHPTVESARNDYINQVRVETAGRNAEMNRIKELRLDFKDYIISEMGLSQLVNGAPPSRDPCEHVIDEAELLQRLGL